MSYGLDTLFARLPAELRKRDYLQGLSTLQSIGQWDTLEDPRDYGPMFSLLSVMLREGQIIERDIDQLYDDHFIETCTDWVVPYIGRLVGAMRLEDLPDVDGHRRIVAATLSLNRAKGTLAALEYASSAATALPVVAVEYWRKTATTVSTRRPRFQSLLTLDVRRQRDLERLGTAFETGSRLFEARSVATQQGRWNLRNIGQHLFETHAVPIGNLDREEGGDELPGHFVRPTTAGPLCFRFHPLRCDTQLYRRPGSSSASLGNLRREPDCPAPLMRWELKERLDPLLNNDVKGTFGPRGVLNISLRNGSTVTDIDPSTVEVADLYTPAPSSGTETWPLSPVSGTTYVDPESGRFILDPNHAGADGVYVSFHEGRTHDIGGGIREASDIIDVGSTATVDMAGSAGVETVPALPGSSDPLNVFFGATTAFVFDGNRSTPASNSLEDVNVVARPGAWPTIYILNSSGLQIACHPGSNFRLSGLRVATQIGSAHTLRITGDDVHITIDDCTLVPGRSLDPGGVPREPGRPSLTLDSGQSVRIRRSILGPIQLADDVELVLEDCIVDAGALDNFAIRADGSAGHRVSIIRCTILGRVEAENVGGPNHYSDEARELGLHTPIVASGVAADEEARGIRDSIFMSEAPDESPPVNIQNIQSGCVSHSFIPPGSRVPRRHACIPMLGEDPVHWPIFRSRRYGDADYFVLNHSNREALSRGASNGSAMGVGNRRMMAARLRNLSTVNDHYLRFGYEAGPIFES